MLGGLIHSRVWRWAAVGKHPAAADYLRLEGGSPLLQAIGDWMIRGYENGNHGRGTSPGNNSWRFWLRGVKRGDLLAGVVRDSSDRIGRPFPLLVVGEGRLKGWEQRWELLPMALDKVWQCAEYIGVHPYRDLAALSAEIGSLPAPPAMDWDSVSRKQPPRTVFLPADLSVWTESLQRDGKALICLNPFESGDPIEAAVNGQLLLKKSAPGLPRAVFLGGNPQKTCLAVLQQPLCLADFEMLWSV